MFAIYKKLLAVNKSQYRSQPSRMKNEGSDASYDDDPREEINPALHLIDQNEHRKNRIIEISANPLNLQNPDHLAQFIELTKLKAEILQAELNIQKLQSPSQDGTPHQLDQKIQELDDLKIQELDKTLGNIASSEETLGIYRQHLAITGDSRDEYIAKQKNNSRFQLLQCYAVADRISYQIQTLDPNDQSTSALLEKYQQTNQIANEADQLFRQLDNELNKYCDVCDATRNEDRSQPTLGSKAFFEHQLASIDLQLFQNQISLLATQALFLNASNQEERDFYKQRHDEISAERQVLQTHHQSNQQKLAQFNQPLVNTTPISEPPPAAAAARLAPAAGTSVTSSKGLNPAHATAAAPLAAAAGTSVTSSKGLNPAHATAPATSPPPHPAAPAAPLAAAAGTSVTSSKGLNPAHATAAAPLAAPASTSVTSSKGLKTPLVPAAPPPFVAAAATTTPAIDGAGGTFEARIGGDHASRTERDRSLDLSLSKLTPPKSPPLRSASPPPPPPPPRPREAKEADEAAAAAVATARRKRAEAAAAAAVASAAAAAVADLERKRVGFTAFKTIRAAALERRGAEAAAAALERIERVATAAAAATAEAEAAAAAAVAAALERRGVEAAAAAAAAAAEAAAAAAEAVALEKRRAAAAATNGNDHSGDNEDDGPYRVELANDRKTLGEKLFEDLLAVENNPVVRVGNNIAFKAWFDADDRDGGDGGDEGGGSRDRINGKFKIEIKKLDDSNGTDPKVVSFSLSDFDIRVEDAGYPINLFYKGISEISGRAAGAGADAGGADGDGDNVVKNKTAAEEFLKDNFSKSREAKFVDFDSKGDFVRILSEINQERNSAGIPSIDNQQSDKNLRYAKILSPFSASISPEFSVEEKKEFAERLNGNTELTRYLLALREYSPAKQVEKASGVNCAIGDFKKDIVIDQKYDIDDETKDLQGRAWVDAQVKKFENEVKRDILTKADTNSCQQVRILYTEKYLTDQEHDGVKKNVEQGAMIILHGNKFGVTQNVIAMGRNSKRGDQMLTGDADSTKKDDGFETNLEFTKGFVRRGCEDLHNGSLNSQQRELNARFFGQYGSVLGVGNFTDIKIALLEEKLNDNVSPQSQNMQGRIAKHIYEIGALSNSRRNSPLGSANNEARVSKISAFKIAQDYLDSQVNARPDYRRVETAKQNAVAIVNSDVEELAQAEGARQNSSAFQYQLGRDKFNHILYNFKNNFGEIGASSSGEPQFHDGSIKITRKQGHPHLIDIVRVIPKDQSQAKKYHDVQYVAIKNKDGNNVQRDIEDDPVSRFCFKKVTLSERGPEFDDKVYYYDDQGNIQNCEVSKIKDDADNTFKKDLARMQIRASVVVDDVVKSKLSTAVLDNSAGVGGAFVKFAMNEIDSDDYKKLPNQLVMTSDRTAVLGDDGNIDASLSAFRHNPDSRKFTFKPSHTPDEYTSHDSATFYHHGHLSDSVLERVKPEIDKKLEAMREQAERSDSPGVAAGRPRNGGSLNNQLSAHGFPVGQA